MSVPATRQQIRQFIESALGNPDSKMMAHFMANVDLFKELAETLTPSPLAWRPVTEYVEKIEEWNATRKWRLSPAKIKRFGSSLSDHLDPLHPTGISLWLGGSLAYNWKEAMSCLKDEVELIGEEFKCDITPDQVRFLPGDGYGKTMMLKPALLDLETYWDPADGVTAYDVRKKETLLPGLEVVWLMALNPSVFAAIDYDTVPALIAAGLVINDSSVASFDRHNGQSVVLDSWSMLRWNSYSVVSFRH